MHSHDQRFRDLAEFIDYDMARLGIGVREYARRVGVAPSTISKHLNRDRVIAATPRLIDKLSRFSGVPRDLLYSLADPARQSSVHFTPRILDLARRLAALPKPLQDEIERQFLSQSRLGDTDESG
jgi:plasmid maintenance system antidote protein VapI